MIDLLLNESLPAGKGHELLKLCNTKLKSFHPKPLYKVFRMFIMYIGTK